MAQLAAVEAIANSNDGKAQVRNRGSAVEVRVFAPIWQERHFWVGVNGEIQQVGRPPRSDAQWHTVTTIEPKNTDGGD